MALATSFTVSLYLVSRSGLSHTRIAYGEPNSSTSPTPAMRLISGTTLLFARLLM